MLKHGTNAVTLPGVLVVYAHGDVVYHALPAGYIECEYVRSNANAWFETPIHMTSESEVIADLQFEGSAGNVYGCYSGSAAKDNLCLYGGSASSNGYIRYNGEVERAFKPTAGTRYVISHSKNGFFANGVQQCGAFSEATFTCASPFLVGQLSGSSSAKYKGRIYRITVKTDGITVLDLVPCRNSSNVYGMYDVVGRAFYQSAGTAFSGG